VAVIGLANPPDDANSVATYVKEHKITSTVVFDCGQAA
jgi:hypothetical protein